MIYLQLFWTFMKVGLFAFGGAYGAIPLIQDAVLRNQWMDSEMFSNMLAISESTPGPIMVNAATYVGSMQAGFFGAFCATFGVVFPAFWIIILISACMNKVIKAKAVQAVLKGIKPCVIGLILATGLYMLYVGIGIESGLDIRAIFIFGFLLAIIFIYGKIRKKEVSSIYLIVISAVIGAVIY